MLTLVPTPIGNLGDISQRALDALRGCNFIIAENPAHTGKLLKLLGLPKKEMVQFAGHNEQRVSPTILQKLETSHGALVSDAGTPGISDPGFRLVRACVEKNIKIVSIPGPCAAITALVGSGLPTDRFLFVGFLPKTEPKLLQILESAKQTDSSLVAYESPQRITKTILFLASTYPSAQIAIARELTKLHEEFLRGTAQEILAALKTRPSIKGEIVLVISQKS